MGAATSVTAVGPAENAPRPTGGPAHTSAKTAELDKYGGTNRPAVKRGESFNKAMGWLGETVATQAEQLQDALVHPVGSEDAVESIDIAPDEPSRRRVPAGGTSTRAGTSKAGASPNKKSGATRGGSEGPSGGRASGKAPAEQDTPMSDTLAKAVKGHRAWQAKVSGGSNNERKGRPAAAVAPTGGGGRVRAGKTVGGVMKSGGGLQGIFSSAGRSNRTQGSRRKDRKGGWRHRVHNAKRTAYMTLKVYLKMNAAWKNQLPEALRTDIAQVVRATLHEDFAKFAMHNERFFRSPSQFEYEPNNLGRAASIRVVDLDQDLASARRMSSGSGGGGEISMQDSSHTTGGEDRASTDGLEVGDQDAAMMEMYARKANAAWVERQNWEAPKVFQMHTYTLSVERTHYNYAAKELLKKGKIAFHFVATGEAVYTPDGRALDAITTDTWHLLTTCAPNKVPCGSRIEGLPPVSRQIIQLIECIERVAGVLASEQLQIVISVGEDEEDLVINLLKEHKFYRLGPKQVHILVQDKQFGFKYESKYGELMEAEESELKLPGSGHALLQLAAPSDALYWDGSHMAPHDGSLLDHFKETGVVWLMSCRLLDLYWCTSHRQTDLDFLGLCLKLHDTSKANMAVEVAPCVSVADMRLNNSVIMERMPGKGQASTTCDVAYTDCQSIKAQDRLKALTSSSDSTMYTSQRRYLFYLPEFREQLMERATFRADIQVRKGYAYLDFDYADITSGPLARCAAVVQKPSQVRPPPPSSVVDFSWLCSLGPLLSKQDAQDGFCARAVQAQSRIAPIAICRKPFAGEQSLHMCLFIADNKASRKAIRLAKVLMQNDANYLRIVTVASTQSGISRAEDMMGFYRELLGVVPSNQLITEVVVRRHGTTVDTLMDYVSRETTDLIIMGSEKLSQEHPMGSVTLAVLKTTALPVLVVKSETLTECTKEDVDKLARSERRSLKLLLRVEHSSRNSLNFAMQMLDPRHDRIALVRCKGNSQLGLGQMEEKNSDKRILESFQDTASARHFSATAINTNLDPMQALPKLASENGCDIMLLRRAVRARLPDEIPKYIVKARTAVLVYHDEDGGKSPSGGVSSKSMLSTGASTKALL